MQARKIACKSEKKVVILCRNNEKGTKNQD